MLRAALLLRYIMCIGSVAALCGALLMFIEAAAKLVGGFRTLLDPDGGGKAVIAAVMGATDASLFGIVLMLFAYGITFGFVIELDSGMRGRLPPWMQVGGVGELKLTLIQVIIMYLVVDFATDIAEGERHFSWETLIMPTAILLIAGALQLMSGAHAQRPQQPGKGA